MARRLAIAWHAAFCTRTGMHNAGEHVVVLGDPPDDWTLLGGAVIIGSGPYILRREHRRAAAAG